MKPLLLAAVLLPLATVMAKPALDLNGIKAWPEILLGEQISADGRYVEYSTHEPPAEPSLTILSTRGDWRREMANFHGSVDLTSDSRRAIILHRDTRRLEILELGSDRNQQIEDVDSYELPRDGNGQWMVYRRSVADSRKSSALVLRDLRSGADHSYPDVTQYQFSRDGRVLLLQTRVESAPFVTRLQRVDLPTATLTTIWQGPQLPGQVVIGPDSGALAFVTSEAEGDRQRTPLWY